jgi:hypothetical protein
MFPEPHHPMMAMMATLSVETMMASKSFFSTSTFQTKKNKK